MAWQIKAIFEGLSPPRWVNKDHRGYFTTRQGRAKFYDTESEANDVRDDIAKSHPAVIFEVIEVPG